MDNKMEIWKEISGNKNYLISNTGKVFSKHKDKLLKLSLTARGYYKVNLTTDAYKYKSVLVHRLVAQHFIDNPNNKPDINHIDSNRINNNHSNLEWCTQQENINHACITGNFNRGEKHGRHKLTENQVQEIRKLSNEITGYKLAKMYNVSSSAIYLILNKTNWKC